MSCAIRVIPSMYSMEMSSEFSSTTRSKIRQTFGEITSRAVRTSAECFYRILTSFQIQTQRLQRNIQTKLHVIGMPHFPHSAFAQLRQDFVTTGNDPPQKGPPFRCRKLGNAFIRWQAGLVLFRIRKSFHILFILLVNNV